MNRPDTGRLDTALVVRGLARSRGQASELIARGAVRVGGQQAAKAGQRVSAETPIEVEQTQVAWVGRGAEKLLAALEAFAGAGLRVAGRRCLDVGASTGGFTQVLLHQGARQVLALDVGHDQLAGPVATDPRVRDLSGRTIRGLTPGDIDGPADLVVVDLSFISLALVMPELAAVTSADGDLVLLIKPQFEVGRTRLGKNGVVKDPADQAAAVLSVCRAAAQRGLATRAVIASPIHGTHGNREFLAWLSTSEAVGVTWQALQQDVHQLVKAKE